MKKILVILLFSLIEISANEKWTYINGLDDFTDEKVQRITYEDENHKFQISNNNGHLWTYITRKKAGTPYKLERHTIKNVLYPSTILYVRIDKGVLHSYDIGWDFESAIYRDETKLEYITINENLIAIENMHFMINGKHPNDKYTFNVKGFLICEMFKGKDLKIKYDTEFLEAEAFKIPLEGFTEAFKKAFDKKLIPECK